MLAHAPGDKFLSGQNGTGEIPMELARLFPITALMTEVVALPLTLGACSTIQGFGQDMAAAGRGLSDAATWAMGGKPATATASPPAATQTAQSGTTQAPRIDNIKIYFAWDSAALDSEATQLADQAATLYRDRGPKVMSVVGHADRTGNEFYNVVLSAERARAVKEALVARGVPATTLQMEAAGAADARSAGDDPRSRYTIITWQE
jgi:outer membrane protein OmpA-like peptidoglycan-associated protein